jgi:hypothetical protein
VPPGPEQRSAGFRATEFSAHAEVLTGASAQDNGVFCHNAKRPRAGKPWGALEISLRGEVAGGGLEPPTHGL